MKSILAALLLSLFPLTGCDLFSSATKFSVDTEWQQFTIDSASLGISIPAATVPAIPCSGNDLCAQAAELKCGGGSYACIVQCGGSTCEIVVTAEANTAIDLSQKIRNNTEASALNKVSLQRVVYNTEENTLNFDTPVLDLAVGPASANLTTDGGVVRFGTMPAIPKGSIVNEIVTPTTEGSAALEALVKDYQTPFKMFFKATVRFASGAALPQGRITLKFKAYFEVEPV